MNDLISGNSQGFLKRKLLIGEGIVIDVLNKKILEKLKDKNYRKNLSLKCNAWVKNHNKPISFANKMKFIYNSILNDQKIEDIRNDLNKIL